MCKEIRSNYLYSLLFITIAIYIACMMLPSIRQAQAGTGVVTASVANIRSEPSTQSAIVGTVYKDTGVTTISKSGEWYQIKFGSITGWMHQSVLLEQSSSADTTSAATTDPPSTPATTAASAPKVVLDGQTMSFDVSPTVVNDRILVPMAAIFRAMGADVEWNEVTQTVIATRGTTQIILPIGSITPVVDGKTWNLDVPARIVNNRTLAPLRFVGEALGGTVTWDEINNTAIITSPTALQGNSDSDDSDNTPEVVAVKNSGSSEVNLREGPGTSYNIVGTVVPGKIFTVLSNQGDWYQVKNGAGTAWVAGWVVTLIYEDEPVSNPDTPITPTAPVSDSNSMTLYSQRSSEGVRIYMESKVKLKTTKTSSAKQVCYSFDDQQIVGTAYLQEYLGSSLVTAQGSNQGDKAKVIINLPAGVQYETTTENNGLSEVLFIPNFISNVARSTFGSSGEKITVNSITAMGYTTSIDSKSLKVTFNNAVTGSIAPSYSYSSSLIKSMNFMNKGENGSVLTITTSKPVKFSVGLNDNATTLNILFVDQSELQSRDPIVILDAGHGGTEPGASGSNLKEKDVNLAVVLKAGKLLTAKGIKVVYTRTDDTFVALEDRSDIANFYNAALFVSVHCNASTSSTPSGTETYCYYPIERPDLYLQKDERYNLALRLQEALIANLGRIDRGVKQQNLAVLRETTMPSALCELAFISNSEEETLLRQQQYQDLAAQAIANAIAGYMKDYVD